MKRGPKTNEERALAQAVAIEQYWAKRGCRVNVEVTQQQFGPGFLLAIKSDLVNGLPRDYRDGGSDMPRAEALDPDYSAPADTSATRVCMCCTKPFQSDGIHNRLCNSCLSSSAGVLRKQGRRE